MEMMKAKIYIEWEYSYFNEPPQRLGKHHHHYPDYPYCYCPYQNIPLMKLENVLFIGGAIIAILLVLWYLLGQSPTLEQLLVALMVANLTFSFKIYGDLQRHIGEHEAEKKDSTETNQKKN